MAPGQALRQILKRLGPVATPPGEATVRVNQQKTSVASELSLDVDRPQPLHTPPCVAIAGSQANQGMPPSPAGGAFATS
jgi:hypothetical protein